MIIDVPNPGKSLYRDPYDNKNYDPWRFYRQHFSWKGSWPIPKEQLDALHEFKYRDLATVIHRG